MNDTPDKPQEPTSAEPSFQEVSEELRLILAKHKKWVEAEDKTGLDHLRATLGEDDLYWAQLYEANLIGAHLNCANLNGANLDGAVRERVKFCSTIMPGGNIISCTLTLIPPNQP